ncbi:hypothetical protein FKP32DRAFT_1673506 [Trametes sanguinea]|nr:hypothetical protein FKP32DRAFT_1673506 [Trametes sanguinea]
MLSLALATVVLIASARSDAMASTPASTQPPLPGTSISPCVSSCIQQSSGGCLNTGNADTADVGCACAFPSVRAECVSCVVDLCAPADTGALEDFLLVQCGAGAPSSVEADSSSDGTILSGSIHSTPTISFYTTAPGTSAQTVSIKSALSSDPPSSESATELSMHPPASSSPGASATSPSSPPAMQSSVGTVSTSGQPVRTATATVIFGSSDSTTHNGPSNTLLVALVASLGTVLLAALLVWVLFVRRRRRPAVNSRLHTASESTVDTPGEEVVPNDEVREIPPGGLLPTIIPPGDERRACSPPDLEPSAMQPAAHATDAIPTGALDALAVSDAADGRTPRADRGAGSLLLEPRTTIPAPQAMPPPAALTPPGPEDVEVEKVPTSELRDAEDSGGIRQVRRRRTEQQDAPSTTQEAVRAFDSGRGSWRREDYYGLFGAEVADDEDPPPYEPRAAQES